jgi:hypothetical protein
MNTEITAFGPSEKISKDIFEIMERLMICIEMGSWVKAEDFAAVIKTRIPEEFKELKNKALRLVLSVRKGEHDNSLLFLSELKDMVNEVNGWKI